MTTLIVILLTLGVAGANLALGFLAAAVFGFGPCTSRILRWLPRDISGSR